MIQRFSDELKKRLRIRMNDLADSLASGDCLTFDSYKTVCGEIKGLAEAERELIDLTETATKGDA